MTIEELRIRIDALDRQLVELLSERARAARTAWLKEKAEEDAAVDEFKRRRRAALGLSADMARVSLNSSGSGAGTVFGAMEA